MFEDREEAGKLLAQELLAYRGTDAVVLALPRGGVALGRAVADALHLPLDIVVVRKVGVPEDPEYALCAVDANGTLLCNEDERRYIDPDWLSAEVARQQAEAARRISAYRGDSASLPLAGKVAILVDDGIATGLTMRLAIRTVKAQRPSRTVVAVPAAAAGAIGDMRKEVDDILVLIPPADFKGAVGAHYRRFPQVPDEEVVNLLRGRA